MRRDKPRDVPVRDGRLQFASLTLWVANGAEPPTGSDRASNQEHASEEGDNWFFLPEGGFEARGTMSLYEAHFLFVCPSQTLLVWTLRQGPGWLNGLWPSGGTHPEQPYGSISLENFGKQHSKKQWLCRDFIEGSSGWFDKGAWCLDSSHIFIRHLFFLSSSCSRHHAPWQASTSPPRQISQLWFEGLRHLSIRHLHWYTWCAYCKPQQLSNTIWHKWPAKARELLELPFATHSWWWRERSQCDWHE